MSSVEKLSEIMASKISLKINSEHDEEVLAYGAFVLIQTIVSILIVSIFGIMFGVLLEAIIISFTASMLRKFSGGAHATTPLNCALISLIVFGGLSLLTKRYLINLYNVNVFYGLILSYVITFYIMFKYCPVGTPTKLLNNGIKRKQLKKKSIKIVLSLLILNLILIIVYINIKQDIFLNIAICITIGVLWQALTMVSLGQRIIHILNKILGGTNNFIRRKNL